MITYDMLVNLEACEKQCELFVELFPNGVEVTEELCVKHAMEFDWEWAAEKLLSPEKSAEYIRASDNAWYECVCVRDDANTEYNRICAEALRDDHTHAEYTRVRDEYHRVRRDAYRKYKRTQARTFAKLYLSS